MSIIRCKECDAEISSEARFCPHCGKPSEQQLRFQGIQDKNSQTVQTPWKSIAKVFALLFALLGSGFGVYMLISSIGMIGELDQFGDLMFPPDLPSILIVAALMLATGSVFLCVGAFKWKSTPAIVGVSAILFAVILVFAIAIPISRAWVLK